MPTIPASESRWQLVARFFCAGFLGAAGLIAGRLGFVPSSVPLLAVAFLIAAYNLTLLIPGFHRSAVRSTSVFLLDVLAVTFYLHYSGDIENPLRFGYSLPIIAGAVLISKRAGFLLAGAATVLFGGLVSLTVLVDAVPHHHLALLPELKLHDLIDPDRSYDAWNYIAVHMIALFAILWGSAFGFGFLAERIREGERRLRSEHERMLLLLGLLPEGICLLRRDGTVLLSNPAARSLHPSIESGTAEAHVRSRLMSFRGPVEEFETHEEVRILQHVLARGTSEEPVVWVARDLTEQRRLAAQIMHHSKMIDLGLLAAGIAHEIGNPLSSMSAVLELMESKGDPARTRERVGSLRGHVDRIARIVRDFTGFARPSAAQKSRVSLDALAEKTLSIFRLHEKARGLKVEVRGGTAGTVEAIEDQIQQVLLNLLLNAADATAPGGTIRLRLEDDSREVRASIEDSGEGMTDEVRRRLFTPFFTTKPQGKGVGLGLFVSESIIRAHRGRIDVESVPGRGSTFTLALPRGSSGPPAPRSERG